MYLFDIGVRRADENIEFLGVPEAFDLGHGLTKQFKEDSPFLDEFGIHVSHRLLGRNGRNVASWPSINQTRSHSIEITVASENLIVALAIVTSDSVEDVFLNSVLHHRITNIDNDLCMSFGSTVK